MEWISWDDGMATPRTTHAAAVTGRLQHLPTSTGKVATLELEGKPNERVVGTCLAEGEKKTKSGFDVTGVGPSNQDQAGRTRPHLIATRARKEPGRGWVVLASAVYYVDTANSPKSTHTLSSPQLTSITFSGLFLRSKTTGHRIFHPIGRANANALLFNMTRWIILTHVVRCVRVRACEWPARDKLGAGGGRWNTLSDKPQPSRYTITTHMVPKHVCNDVATLPLHSHPIRISGRPAGHEPCDWDSSKERNSVYTADIPAMPLVSNRITSPFSRRHNLHKDNQVQQAEVNTSFFSQHQKDPFVFSPCLYNARRPFAVLAILDLVSLTLQAALRQGTEWPKESRFARARRIHPELGLMGLDEHPNQTQHADGPTEVPENEPTMRLCEWMSRRGVRQSQSCVPPAAVHRGGSHMLITAANSILLLLHDLLFSIYAVWLQKAPTSKRLTSFVSMLVDRHAYPGGMMPAFLAVARHLLSCLQRLSLSLTQILSLSPSPKAFKLSTKTPQLRYPKPPGTTSAEVKRWNSDRVLPHSDDLVAKIPDTSKGGRLHGSNLHCQLWNMLFCFTARPRCHPFAHSIVNTMSEMRAAASCLSLDCSPIPAAPGNPKALTWLDISTSKSTPSILNLHIDICFADISHSLVLTCKAATFRPSYPASRSLGPLLLLSHKHSVLLASFWPVATVSSSYPHPALKSCLFSGYELALSHLSQAIPQQYSVDMAPGYPIVCRAVSDCSHLAPDFEYVPFYSHRFPACFSYLLLGVVARPNGLTLIDKYGPGAGYLEARARWHAESFLATSICIGIQSSSRIASVVVLVMELFLSHVLTRTHTHQTHQFKLTIHALAWRADNSIAPRQNASAASGYTLNALPDYRTLPSCCKGICPLLLGRSTGAKHMRQCFTDLVALFWLLGRFLLIVCVPATVTLRVALPWTHTLVILVFNTSHHPGFYQHQQVVEKPQWSHASKQPEPQGWRASFQVLPSGTMVISKHQPRCATWAKRQNITALVFQNPATSSRRVARGRWNRCATIFPAAHSSHHPRNAENLQVQARLKASRSETGAPYSQTSPTFGKSSIICAAQTALEATTCSDKAHLRRIMILIVGHTMRREFIMLVRHPHDKAWVRFTTTRRASTSYHQPRGLHLHLHLHLINKASRKTEGTNPAVDATPFRHESGLMPQNRWHRGSQIRGIVSCTIFLLMTSLLLGRCEKLGPNRFRRQSHLLRPPGEDLEEINNPKSKIQNPKSQFNHLQWMRSRLRGKSGSEQATVCGKQETRFGFQRPDRCGVFSVQGTSPSHYPNTCSIETNGGSAKKIADTFALMDPGVSVSRVLVSSWVFLALLQIGATRQARRRSPFISEPTLSRAIGEWPFFPNDVNDERFPPPFSVVEVLDGGWMPERLGGYEARFGSHEAVGGGIESWEHTGGSPRKVISSFFCICFHGRQKASGIRCFWGKQTLTLTCRRGILTERDGVGVGGDFRSFLSNICFSLFYSTLQLYTFLATTFPKLLSQSSPLYPRGLVKQAMNTDQDTRCRAFQLDLYGAIAVLLQ
ncbi:uncharacterized protein CLUP02_17647 [Colletotrichum lupini]|uniref:Uncharacterized protein n=1 Tax=Colletotrichum lupini TaxID=145971 RepID=A0A9Q8SFU0_9PEZI|nr:uncharacterized protein CLUP02_17647 [Colletotrichum lupini]UQC76136.1 hypothetical protein CLUP02_17647 [Colletotrichum lupini]